MAEIFLYQFRLSRNTTHVANNRNSENCSPFIIAILHEVICFIIDRRFVYVNRLRKYTRIYCYAQNHFAESCFSMYCAQKSVHLDEYITHRHETSPGDYTHCIKLFYVKKFISINVTIRSVFQNPVTYN